MSQECYVNTCLETVEIPKGVNEARKQDNQSTVGALSWLVAQSRPDIQAGVSLAHNRQKDPTYHDIKLTNQVVRMAQQGQGEPLKYSSDYGLDNHTILVFHDAAWANASATEDDLEADDQETDIYLATGLCGAHRGQVRPLERKRECAGAHSQRRPWQPWKRLGSCTCNKGYDRWVLWEAQWEVLPIYSIWRKAASSTISLFSAGTRGPPIWWTVNGIIKTLAVRHGARWKALEAWSEGAPMGPHWKATCWPANKGHLETTRVVGPASCFCNERGTIASFAM